MPNGPYGQRGLRDLRNLRWPTDNTLHDTLILGVLLLALTALVWWVAPLEYLLGGVPTATAESFPAVTPQALATLHTLSLRDIGVSDVSGVSAGGIDRSAIERVKGIALRGVPASEMPGQLAQASCSAGNATNTTSPATVTCPAVVLYIGAEFCPYCATLRWPLVLALMRFGTFDHLGTTRSGVHERFAGTWTFSFVGSHYRSRWIDFQPVELADRNQKSLQRPSAMQGQLFKTLDSPPPGLASPAPSPFCMWPAPQARPQTRSQPGPQARACRWDHRFHPKCFTARACTRSWQRSEAAKAPPGPASCGKPTG